MVRSTVASTGSCVVLSSPFLGSCWLVAMDTKKRSGLVALKLREPTRRRHRWLPSNLTSCKGLRILLSTTSSAVV